MGCLNRFQVAFGISGVWTITASTGEVTAYQWHHLGGTSTFTGTRLSDDRAIVNASIRNDTVEWTIGEITYAGRLADFGRRIENGRYWHTDVTWKQDDEQWDKETSVTDLGTFNG